MFDSYKEIFTARGDSYNKAMREYPDARVQEFQYLFDVVNTEPNDIVCDIPSGGCYLARYLNIPTEIFSVDSCSEFITNSQMGSSTHLLISEPNNTAIKSQCFDKLFSLAGIHHMEDKTLFFDEVRRLLKPGGQFCIADVEKNSKVDFFLDNIVDKYNSHGHRGDYLDNHTIDQIKSSGLTVCSATAKNFYWCFDSLEHATNFCILLFGLDKVDRKQLTKELSSILGIRKFDDGIGLHWRLLYISGISK